MEQNSTQSPDKRAAMYGRFSIMAGIFSLFSCMSPPVQLLFGAVALMMAYLSRNISRAQGNRNILAAIGALLGVTGVFASFLLLGCYVLSVRLMDDPTYAAMQRELIKQYMNLFNSAPAQ